MLKLTMRVNLETLVCCFSLDYKVRTNKRLLSICFVLLLLVLQAEFMTSKGS